MISSKISHAFVAASPMRGRLLCIGLAAAVCAGQAGAGELPGGRAGKPALARSICAAYGTGFVPIAGSDTCVRISGHVRMEYTFGRAAPQPSRGSDSGASAYAGQDGLPSPPDAGLVFGRLKPPAQTLPPISGKPRGINAGLTRITP